jgi:hypothetical protein
MVAGYMFRENQYLPNKYLTMPAPAAGLYSTVLDLAKIRQGALWRRTGFGGEQGGHVVANDAG